MSQNIHIVLNVVSINNIVLMYFFLAVDSITPIISSCPVDLTETVPLGSAGTVVTWVEPQVSDNSGIVNLISQTHTSGSFFVVGDTSVIYTYADPTDNRVICSFVISVIEGRFSMDFLHFVFKFNKISLYNIEKIQLT